MGANKIYVENVIVEAILDELIVKRIIGINNHCNNLDIYTSISIYLILLTYNISEILAKIVDHPGLENGVNVEIGAGHVVIGYMRLVCIKDYLLVSGVVFVSRVIVLNKVILISNEARGVFMERFFVNFYIGKLKS